ncbi:hypothetical protein CPB84DRAFT_1849206 [Gymnopilus junonius]|uniref:Uncharacterized protein n=1 Tax=Gymnopilus junonius TaxID=109634 RepID=A0A9P5NJ88_GYMJU|nr:hypothetical protein CPB84DRAFT_1849206 [Gymnopilus junonius]
MPAVEIASFTATKAFLSDVSTAAFDKAIDAVKETDGCSRQFLSVYHGFQQDDKTRAYVLIETYVNATKSEGLSVLKVESNKLGLSFDDISIQLPKLGHTEAELISFVQAFYIQAENNEYIDLQPADLAIWALGVSKPKTASNVYLVGWKGVEHRKTALNKRSYADCVKSVFELAEFEVKVLFLTKA